MRPGENADSWFLEKKMCKMRCVCWVGGETDLRSADRSQRPFCEYFYAFARLCECFCERQICYPLVWRLLFTHVWAFDFLQTVVINSPSPHNQSNPIQRISFNQIQAINLARSSPPEPKRRFSLGSSRFQSRSLAWHPGKTFDALSLPHRVSLCPSVLPQPGFSIPHLLTSPGDRQPACPLHHILSSPVIAPIHKTARPIAYADYILYIPPLASHHGTPEQCPYPGRPLQRR